MAVSKDDFIKNLFPESAATTSVTSGSSSQSGPKKLALVSVGSKFRVRRERVLCTHTCIHVYYIQWNPSNQDPVYMVEPL